ncbi:hypothetical protein PBI_SCTP2_524 [Salicola phage SCTP-2]|nr:hypothetical protein PBI_SCTP2_524 [Salicola phage SCTP-2]
MKKFKTIVTMMIIAMALVVAGCNKDTTSEKQEEVRDDVLTRANNAEPPYKPSNFLVRQYVNEYMKRLDNPNKTWYIYLLGDNGNHIGYYVARSHPVNICTFLTPPDKIEGMGDSRRVRKAPALDGAYYGGGACNKEYFFTASTDALMSVPTHMKKIVSDQPLEIDVEQIKVQIQK